LPCALRASLARERFSARAVVYALDDDASPAADACRAPASGARFILPRPPGSVGRSPAAGDPVAPAEVLSLDSREVQKREGHGRRSSQPSRRRGATGLSAPFTHACAGSRALDASGGRGASTGVTWRQPFDSTLVSRRWPRHAARRCGCPDGTSTMTIARPSGSRATISIRPQGLRFGSSSITTSAAASRRHS
jgi:hypothetical protein